MQTNIAIANHLGVDKALITRYRREGMPNSSLESADAWYRQNVNRRVRVDEVPDYQESRARREAAEAELAELKAAQLRKELVPVADVERQWSGEAGRVREAFLQLADRLAPVLEMRPIGFIRQTLDAEVRQVLTGLSE
jgi:phage terminase Nu1 subunit (DNA packaging protein)